MPKLMRKIGKTGLILLFGLNFCSTKMIASETPAPFVSQSLVAGFDHEHLDWRHILEKFSKKEGSSTLVDYRALKADPEMLNRYLQEAESVTRDQYSRFSGTEKLTFLINAYNALTVKLIVDHYPVKSIKDVGTVFRKAWKISFFKLLGQEMNLDGIEHDTIRKNFNEPRIHLALVCAARSCPSLRAYGAAHLSAELDENAKDFLRDTKRNKFDVKERKLYLSKIFDWYGEDFVKVFGSVRSFIAPRITIAPGEQEAIQNKDTDITWLDYDWSLNDLKK